MSDVRCPMSFPTAFPGWVVDCMGRAFYQAPRHHKTSDIGRRTSDASALEDRQVVVRYLQDDQRHRRVVRRADAVGAAPQAVGLLQAGEGRPGLGPVDLPV